MMEKNSDTNAQTSDEPTTPMLVSSDGTPYEITAEGSLGLLALGYTGVMLWREKRFSGLDPQVQTSDRPHNR